MTKQIKKAVNITLVLATVFLAGVFASSQRMPAQETPLPGRDSSLLVRLPEAGLTSGFMVDTLCNVSGERPSLVRFFSELQDLRRGKDTVISVVQLGDSHIQAGYFSGELMRLFHRDFGNAGRGLIVPLKLTRTNEPDDYFIRSTSGTWTNGRVTQSRPLVPAGLGGIGIRTTARKVNLDVIIGEKNGEGYSFNKALLFRHPDALPLIATGQPSGSVKTYQAKDTLAGGLVCDTFRIAGQTDTLLLRSHTVSSAAKNMYYGLILQNGKPGVLFHSIGVNGAMFVNYSKDEYMRQLAVLQPSLLIVSLGTNETFGKRFSESEFTGQVSGFLDLVRKYLPRTAILLTTPPECFKRVRVNKKYEYVRNENTERAARAVEKLALEKGVACWDLFAATGGKGSSESWYASGLLGKDRIHFTREAYREQGDLLYRAMMKDYNRYASISQDVRPYVQQISSLIHDIR